MDTHQLESYLKRARELSLQKQHDPEAATHSIFHLLEEQQNAIQGNYSAEAFFNGEYHFLHGDHEQALKCYLEAKEVPNFEFFCYRSSALISYDRGQEDQAIHYAEKALAIDPEDPTLRELIDSLKLTPFASNENENNSEANSNESHFDTRVECSEPFETCTNPPNTSVNNLKDPILFETGKESEAEPLEARIKQFQTSQAQHLQHYLQQAQQRQIGAENALYILNGWTFPPAQTPLLLTEESRQSHGGHFIRWNGKGIVLNPGPGFLEHFHEQGLCVRDIDHVIVTRPALESYGDVKGIAELSLQLNKAAADRHIIHYYLHQKAYQDLSHHLKPSFKQARNTIHKLEMFLDSPDVEKIELNDGIVLHYFLPTMQESLYTPGMQHRGTHHSNLGLRLELSSETKKVSIGYLTGICWSPLIAHHLGHCDILLAAFGNTNSTDYSMLGYNEDSLGYCGTATLAQQLNPKLLLLTEFGGREGDIRIEVTKKMRSDSTAQTTNAASSLIPADIGLTVNLESLKIRCSLSQKFVAPRDIHVIANSESFGRLNYLSNHFYM